MKESKIQKKIIDYITAQGGYAINIVNASLNGTPDIVACIGGKFVAVEVKTDIGDSQPLQIYTAEVIRSLGGIALVSRSVEEFKQQMKDLLF